jgi:hypothetical protein
MAKATVTAETKGGFKLGRVLLIIVLLAVLITVLRRSASATSK